MSGKEEFVIIKDKESIERMLENAEIEYEEEPVSGDIVAIKTENGIVFELDQSGELKGLYSEY